MKKLKHLLLTMTLAMFMAQPAMADILDKDDMAFAFGNSPASSGLGEMALLSHQEMVETEGEWAPFAARFGWGSLSGGMSYSVTNWGAPSWSWGGFGRSVVYGGVGGLFGRSPAWSATFGAGSSAGLGRWGW